MTRHLPSLCLLLGLACGAQPSGTADGGAALIADFEARHARAQRELAVAPDEEARYDALAQAFVGRALTQRFRRAQAVARRLEKDHATLVLDEVTHDRVEILGADAQGVQVEATWRMRGSLLHSGHIHPRHLRAIARFRLEPGEDGWRIAAVIPVDWQELPAAAPTPAVPPTPDLR